MKIELEPGTYVVAVSGGVDSMALLHALINKCHRSKVRLVIAHLDHGIRPDAREDRQLVQEFAVQHQLPFVYHEARLGPDASEGQARTVRYAFLHTVRQKAGARAIITAHHKDDALETAAHNVFRGTGRSGLSSLRETAYIKRPLLQIDKEELMSYAKAHGLQWREDSTNTSLAYTRNYIRHQVLPKLSVRQKQELTGHIEKAAQLNEEIDRLLALQLHLQPAVHQLSRKWFVGLPHAVAREAMAAWLRNNGIRNFDKKMLERLVVAAKTFHPDKAFSVNKDYFMQVQTDILALIH